MRKIAIEPRQQEMIEVRERPKFKPPRDDLRKDRNLGDKDFTETQNDPDLEPPPSAR